MNGILIIDKPEGVICQKLLNQIKKSVGKIKLGFTGTLDPFATGVLPVFLGEATKIIPYLDENKKIYEATVKLGEMTDTMDRDGKVLGTSGVPNLSHAQILDVLKNFIGKQLQTPPIYSAIKKDGIPLYRYARKGITVEVQPRGVEIFSIELIDYHPPLLTFKTEVSKGTYIRSLGLKIAENLQTVGHLTSLRRVKSGLFEIGEAIEWQSLQEIMKDVFKTEEVLKQKLLSVLQQWQSWTVEDETSAIRFIQGMPVLLQSIENLDDTFPILIKSRTHVLGIGKLKQNLNQEWQIFPERMLKI
jgi:tRNA pseudouridine55 synthase